MTAKDPLRYFRVEAREIAEELSRGAAEIETAANPGLIARMMRLAHTLKGAASVVKQRAIAERTHALEDALAPLRDREGEAPADAVEIILGHVDAIAEAVAALDPAAVRPPVRTAQTALDETVAMLRADANEIDGVLDGIAEARVRLRALRKTAGKVEQARHLAELIADWTARPPTPDAAAPARMRQFAEDLRNLIADLGQGLRGGIDQNERELEQAHAAAERMRLLPCSAAFGAFERAVADSARALGKRAALSVRGGDVRLDPQVLGLVQRAVVQLLRNAVAHGIETPGERRAAGKAEAGAIAVEVVRRGDRIVVGCIDDGAGIDLEAVRRAARARGIAVSGNGDPAVLDVLLAGGLSTSSTVTEASGRGVGLDVVREIAQRLGAEVRAETRAGQGTRIELAVPVSLSSLDALLVEVRGATIALPLGSVLRAVRLAPGDVARDGERETIVQDGEGIAIVPLAQLVRLAPRTGEDGAKSAIVVQGAAARVALRIDTLVGTANLVVRPVPPLAFADPVLAGAYFDAEGVPRPVLDPEALVRAASGATVAPDRATRRAPPPILVIDDSLTTRVLEQSILESAGFVVDLATCAEEGLEKARERRYGLFLVDVEMPGMDGFGFVETTRADPDLREVPAILVSSRAAPEDIERGRRAGAHAYFIKSEFDQRQVLATIRSVLDRS